VQSHLRRALAGAASLPANLFTGKAGVAMVALAVAEKSVRRPLGFAP
jgi:hypothetical protein